MNVLDLIIIATIGLMVGVGFFLGIGRVTSGIIALYFSAIVTATFYIPIANRHSRFGHPDEHVYRATPRVRRALSWDGGHFLRSDRALFPLDRALGPFRDPRQHRRGESRHPHCGGDDRAGDVGDDNSPASPDPDNTQAGAGILGMMRDQVQTSALVPIFLKLLPVLTSTLRPWFPSGLPSILKRRSTSSTCRAKATRRLATDIVTTLEFDRVRTMLQSALSIFVGHRTRWRIGPSSDPGRVRYLLDVTTEAFVLVEAYPSFGARRGQRHSRIARTGRASVECFSPPSCSTCSERSRARGRPDRSFLPHRGRLAALPRIRRVRRASSASIHR